MENHLCKYNRSEHYFACSNVLCRNSYFQSRIESFYYCTVLNFEIPPALILQLEVRYMVDRILTGLTAQQIVQLLDGIQIKKSL